MKMSFKDITEVSSAKCFGGHQKVYSHVSDELKCKMNFSIYLPPQVDDGAEVPVMYWLSGLTCTEQNFIIKSGFQRYAAENGLIVVGPDTSPRGCGIEGEDDVWDCGTGAGFYVNASQTKWKDNYRMYAYVTGELPQIIAQNFPINKERQSICGHSMGGHGSLICALKNPGMYSVVTAFAPIANPVNSPWGKKCFTQYLGTDENEWNQWDATVLVQQYNGPPLHIIIDQGSADPYLEKELLPNNFVDACAKAKVPVMYRKHEGYDHGYFFIATFIEEHIKHHAKIMYQK